MGKSLKPKRLKDPNKFRDENDRKHYIDSVLESFNKEFSVGEQVHAIITSGGVPKECTIAGKAFFDDERTSFVVPLTGEIEKDWAVTHIFKPEETGFERVTKSTTVFEQNWEQKKQRAAQAKTQSASAAE